MSTIPEDSCVQRYERLCAAKREQRIGVRLDHSKISILGVTDRSVEGLAYNAEQEQNHDRASTDATGDGAPKDTPGRRNARVLGLLCYVP